MNAASLIVAAAVDPVVRSPVPDKAIIARPIAALPTAPSARDTVVIRDVQDSWPHGGEAVIPDITASLVADTVAIITVSPNTADIALRVVAALSPHDAGQDATVVIRDGVASPDADTAVTITASPNTVDIALTVVTALSPHDVDQDVMVIRDAVASPDADTAAIMASPNIVGIVLMVAKASSPHDVDQDVTVIRDAVVSRDADTAVIITASPNTADIALRDAVSCKVAVGVGGVGRPSRPLLVEASAESVKLRAARETAPQRRDRPRPRARTATPPRCRNCALRSTNCRRSRNK